MIDWGPSLGSIEGCPNDCHRWPYWAFRLVWLFREGEAAMGRTPFECSQHSAYVLGKWELRRLAKPAQLLARGAILWMAASFLLRQQPLLKLKRPPRLFLAAGY